MKYIAYGSNMNLKQMAYRCPTAKLLGTAELEGYELEFRGRPHGAFATVSPLENHNVPVALWELTDQDEQSLDFYEGCPVHYSKETIDIAFEGGKVPALIYIMTPEIGKELGMPTAQYLKAVEQGYESNRIPIDELMRAFNKSLNHDSAEAAEQGLDDFLPKL